MTREPQVWQAWIPGQGFEYRTLRHEQEEAIVKFMLRTLAASALMVLAADVCFAATAGSSVIGKKQAAAIRLAHPQAPRGGARLNSAPRNGAARTATAADAQ